MQTNETLRIRVEIYLQVNFKFAGFVFVPFFPEMLRSAEVLSA